METITEINQKLDMIRAAVGSAQSPAARVDLFSQYRELLRQKAALLNNQREPMRQRMENASSQTAELTKPVARPSMAFRFLRWIGGI